jgi:integrase
MNMAYIEAHKMAWSPSTLKSETLRLKRWAPHLNGNAQELFDKLSACLGRYTIVTTWTRVVDYWGWCNPGQPNPYRMFREENARLFKHAYQSKKVGITYEEAFEAINTRLRGPVRERALDLLGGGVRWCESTQPKSDAAVIVGKGGKLRADFRPNGQDSFDKSYETFRKTLKASTGLTPHSLRKLAATRAAEKGASAADLCEIFGWSSIQTAFRYLQPKKVEQLKGLMR